MLLLLQIGFLWGGSCLQLNEEREKYCRENPIDYIKMLDILNQFPNQHETWKLIYRTAKLYIPERVYKYYSLTPDNHLNTVKFNTLENKEVYLSHSNDFNDPFDNRSFYYDFDVLKKYKFGNWFDDDFIEENANRARIASFSKSGVNNFPMWAHYSNNHQGFCVSYLTDNNHNNELSPSIFPVQYIEGRINITPYLEKFLKQLENQYNKAIKRNQNEILLSDFMLVWINILTCNIKEKHWEYEQEFRVMKPVNVPRPEFMKANPEAIYIGYKCKAEYKIKLVNIAFNLDIPIYEMKLNTVTEKFELVPKRIYL